MGETSKSIAERSLQHWKDFKDKKEDSNIFKHQQLHHGGDESPQFHMRVVKYYPAALRRQIGEATRIRRRGDGVILNSKAEYNRCHITRLTLPEVVTYKEKKPEGEEDKPGDWEGGMCGEGVHQARAQAVKNLESAQPTKRQNPGTELLPRAKKLRYNVVKEDWGEEDGGGDMPGAESPSPWVWEMPPLPQRTKGRIRKPRPKSPPELDFQKPVKVQIAKVELDKKGLKEPPCKPHEVLVIPEEDLGPHPTPEEGKKSHQVLLAPVGRVLATGHTAPSLCQSLVLTTSPVPNRTGGQNPSNTQPWHQAKPSAAKLGVGIVPTKPPRKKKHVKGGGTPSNNHKILDYFKTKSSSANSKVEMKPSPKLVELYDGKDGDMLGVYDSMMYDVAKHAVLPSQQELYHSTSGGKTDSNTKAMAADGGGGGLDVPVY